MKNQILSIISAITILFVVISCSTEPDNKQQLNNEFDYSIYENNKLQLHSLVNRINDKTYRSESISKLEQATITINEINEEFNSNLELNNLDLDVINSNNINENWEEFYLNNGYIEQQQIDLINQFKMDVVQTDFNNAISNLESSILELNLNDRQFQEYNLFINTLYIMNDYFVNYESLGTKTTVLAREKPSWFADAVAANAVATYGLVACAIPNPTSPAGCTVAVVGKALSFAGIIFGC
ncbi:hypothetical protein C8N26_0582 [Tenacibaculum lutimaris]|uniref:Uncharacterized protein n=1 Tax=Tenacibaculum lutimaris TaxID=285258 RepID=A0A420E4T3_9FLAO|nr:hypothetical protein [Tenacibaculum lutimaris]RKF05181.1 hypothetical protein C8N26_0582 [Tenacibaculum lutimaris]